MRHIVIGGGIAGVCCVEELCRLRPDDSVTLVSSSPVLKGIDSVTRITRTIEEVSIRERSLQSLQYPNLTVLQAAVTSINIHDKEVHVSPGGVLSYDRLCIACGARPKVLPFTHERLITLRDTQSVEAFAAQLPSARRIAVVGNGGIALELVGAVRDIEVVWVMKHEHIGDAFFDVDAAEFLLGELQHQQQQQQQNKQQQGVETQQESQQQHQQNKQQQQQQQQQDQQQQQQGTQPQQHSQQPQDLQQQHQQQQQQQQHTHQQQQHNEPSSAAVRGHAAGPKWVDSLPKGRVPANVRIERHALVVGVASSPQQLEQPTAQPDTPAQQQQPNNTLNTPNGSCTAPASSSNHNSGSGSSNSGQQWPLWLKLSSGDTVGVDLVVQAIGVEPSTDWLPAELRRAPDGGILVGANLESVSTPGVFAAGDCCTVDPQQQSPHWFQMRLWTQARLMGLHAAAGMAGLGEDELLSFNLELFTQVTRFLGRKVVLLGLYNGQKLGHQPPGDVVMYSRALQQGSPAATFVRVLLLRGRMQGAVLIGETDLEETFENLILDGLDLSQYGPGLLDPDVELDHVFD